MLELPIGDDERWDDLGDTALRTPGEKKDTASTRFFHHRSGKLFV